MSNVLGGWEDGVVPVGGAQADHDVLSFVELLAGEHRIGETAADEELRRRVDAQRLLDDPIDQRTICSHACVECGVECETVEGTPDEIACRLRARADHEQDLHPDGAAGESHAVDLGGEEPREGVLWPVRLRHRKPCGDAVVDVLRELRNSFRHGDRTTFGCSGRERGADLVGPRVVARGIGRGEPDEASHRVRRYGVHRDGHDVDALGAGSC